MRERHIAPFIVLLVLILFCVGLARAQQAETRNVYSAPGFSISFGGKVETEIKGTDAAYTAYLHGGDIIETVIVRKLSGDIAVTTASSDFYINQVPAGATILSRSTDTLDGHPYTYAYVDLGEGAAYRIRTTIVDSRTVVHTFLTFKKSVGNTDDEWHYFADSLQFKACWLPEGCK